MSGLRLGVNIDHVATLRQARYATMSESKNAADRDRRDL
jgi:pyridoxine 5'-phosphate synthase PdxJ